MAEVWREIEGFPGYEVSDQGRVRSNKTGEWKIRKPSKTAGYCYLILRLDGKSHGKLVHRLVAQAFIPNPNELPEVNHLKGLKEDNRASELEWSTKIQNIEHAIETGLIATGKSHRSYDHTVYNFFHPELGDFTGTRYDFRTRYGIEKHNLVNLIKGKQKTCRGWSLKND